jgi:hypothetical protein
VRLCLDLVKELDKQLVGLAADVFTLLSIILKFSLKTLKFEKIVIIIERP